jgi:hypothetical protein
MKRLHIIDRMVAWDLKQAYRAAGVRRNPTISKLLKLRILKEIGRGQYVLNSPAKRRR